MTATLWRADELSFSMRSAPALAARPNSSRRGAASQPFIAGHVQAFAMSEILVWKLTGSQRAIRLGLLYPLARN